MGVQFIGQGTGRARTVGLHRHHRRRGRQRCPLPDERPGPCRQLQRLGQRLEEGAVVRIREVERGGEIAANGATIAKYESDQSGYQDRATIAEKVGPNLTTKNWQKTVNSFGKIELPPNKFSSLCKGKYDAQDDFQLISYDSSIGESGDWKTLSPVKDVSGGVCTKAAS